MQYDDVVKGRRSIRGYLQKPVAKALIKDVLQLAMRAPSSLNTQPWHFHVVTGEPLHHIARENLERTLNGVPESREFREHGPYQGIHRMRQKVIASQLFDAMQISWKDKEKRMQWGLRGFRQFDAPVCIVVTYDRSIHGGDIGPFDCGAVANAIVNAAWSRGLGCVINSQGIMQSPVIRKHAQIPEDEVIMICIAMGWPDNNFPANHVVSTRKTLDEAACFIGFVDG